MLVIDLKALGKHVAAAVQFLSSRLDEQVKARGGQIQLTSINDRAAKLLLHKFLRQGRLENFRVVVDHPGLIIILAPSAKKRVPFEKPRSTAVPLTIPQYQVGAELGGIVPKPGQRKWKE